MAVNIGDPAARHEMERGELAYRFAYHPPIDDAAIRAHETVRRLCGQLASTLHDILKPGRSKALALNALEETMMHANASIARDGYRLDPGLVPGAGGDDLDVAHAAGVVPTDAERGPYVDLALAQLPVAGPLCDTRECRGRPLHAARECPRAERRP